MVSSGESKGEGGAQEDELNKYLLIDKHRFECLGFDGPFIDYCFVTGHSLKNIINDWDTNEGENLKIREH